MFIVTAEGPGYINKRNWTCHVVIGMYDTDDKADDAIEDIINDKNHIDDDAEMFLVTEVVNNKVISVRRYNGE